MKLLGLLPVATGTGVFLLLTGNTELLSSGGGAAQQQTTAQQALQHALTAIGCFGFLFSLGLFAYELFGIKRCHYLIATGRQLEFELGVHGQFQNRPPNLLWIINEPLATALIYPASMAAWVYLAVAYTPSPWIIPMVVFGTGLVVTEALAYGIGWTTRRGFRNAVLEQVQLADPKEGATVVEIAQSLHADHQAVRRAVNARLRPRTGIGDDDVLVLHASQPNASNQNGRQTHG